VFTNTFTSIGGMILYMGLCSVLAARHHQRLGRRREQALFAHSAHSLPEKALR
jgi:hypothetical protein